jgi:hemoglobin
MQMNEKSLYERLGGYDAISAVVERFIPRLVADDKLGRFWAHRGNDGIVREKQLLVDFLCNAAGGPMYYTGRNMTLVHVGMRIDGEDWQRAVGHLRATLEAMAVPAVERDQVLGFIESLRGDIVEA